MAEEVLQALEEDRMRNITAVKAAIEIVDGVYADMVLEERILKRGKLKTSLKKRINKILKVRYGLSELYEDLGK